MAITNLFTRQPVKTQTVDGILSAFSETVQQLVNLQDDLRAESADLTIKAENMILRADQKYKESEKAERVAASIQKLIEG